MTLRDRIQLSSTVHTRQRVSDRFASHINVRVQPRPDLGGFFAFASSAVGCNAGFGCWAGCAAKKDSTDNPMSFAI